MFSPANKRKGSREEMHTCKSVDLPATLYRIQHMTAEMMKSPTVHNAEYITMSYCTPHHTPSACGDARAHTPSAQRQQ